MTITWLWDGGFDFALISYMEWENAGKSVDYMKMIASMEPRESPDTPNPWRGVERADQLAGAIHDAALGKYPESDYAKLYGKPAEGMRRLVALGRQVEQGSVRLQWKSLPYPVPECSITFDPAGRLYGFEVRFAGQAPHYHMRVFESLARTLAWIDARKERVWEEPSDADESCILLSRRYLPESVRARLMNPADAAV